MLSQGQSRKQKVAFISVAIFLISTYLIFSFFNNLFGNNNTENVTTFDIIKTIVPYTASFSFTFYGILAFIFGRESNKVLPKGFFTTTSWLDIKHNSLVSISNNDLMFLEIEDKNILSVQSSYQNSADFESLFKLSGAENYTRIPLNEITNITSEHNAHFLSVSRHEENHTLDFMTPLVKAHFLVSIKKHLSNSLEYSKKKTTRLQAIIPSSVIMLILAGIAYYFSSFMVSFLLAAFALFAIFPLFVKSLIDPPVVEVWNSPTNEESEELHNAA